MAIQHSANLLQAATNAVTARLGDFGELGSGNFSDFPVLEFWTDTFQGTTLEDLLTGSGFIDDKVTMFVFAGHYVNPWGAADADGFSTAGAVEYDGFGDRGFNLNTDSDVTIKFFRCSTYDYDVEPAAEYRIVGTVGVPGSGADFILNRVTMQRAIASLPDRVEGDQIRVDQLAYRAIAQ